VLREHVAQRFGIHRARAQEVDAHPAAFDIHRPASDQRAQCRSGCAIHAQARAGINGGRGADDDDAAALAHERQRALNGEGAVTTLSPLQYQKRVRLLRARMLMIASAKSVTTAAFEVGYESATQFSRDYARVFGLPPARDAGRILEATKV
jgi:transcriptional regulator GlxA family with amidase domain